MRAVGVGVGHEDDPAVARCVDVEGAAEPAPTTWMIEAHSAFLSTSATVAFCTLRILPRIGSSAWNSESRASFAVPSAESPSTMNSSERSTSLDRQSASLAGSAEVSSAFLRRWVSRCWRAAKRVFAAPATFSMTSLAWAFSARLVEVRKLLSSAETTLRTTDRAAGVPSTSLVCPSNCGSASRTVTTAVSPSRTSSLITSPSLALSTRDPRMESLKVLVSADSNPATWVPPFGVAITLTNERISVS